MVVKGEGDGDLESVPGPGFSPRVNPRRSRCPEVLVANGRGNLHREPRRVRRHSSAIPSVFLNPYSTNVCDFKSKIESRL